VILAQRRRTCTGRSSTSATPPSGVASWSGGSRLSAAGRPWKRAPRPLAYSQLVLGEGAVWALAGNVSGRPESIAEIDPVTGRITRAFTYAEAADTKYDFWGLYATVGQGSIWVLAPLGHNEVVRVSMTTGRPLSVVYPGGSCSEYCSQIYDTAGAVWEPTSQQIVRIDPARMPG
jgi:hypothetical protein